MPVGQRLEQDFKLLQHTRSPVHSGPSKAHLAVACSRDRVSHCAAPLDSRHSRRPRRLSQINIISCGRGVQPPGSNHTEPNEEGRCHWAAGLVSRYSLGITSTYAVCTRYTSTTQQVALVWDHRPLPTTLQTLQCCCNSGAEDH